MRVPLLRFVFDRKHRAKAGREGMVELRITYNNRAKYMSTGVRLLPRQWRGEAVVNRPDAQELNRLLEKMRSEVLRVVYAMMDEGCGDIREIPARLERLHHEGMTFTEFCRERAEVRKYGRKRDSRERYDRFLRFFESWGKIRFFSDVTERNIMEMDRVLAAKGMKVYSKWQNYHRFLNSFIADAVSAGLLGRNPYKWLNIEKGKEGGGLHKYLTPEELLRIERAVLPSESLRKVRDLFVFQTYTCLSYTDLADFDFTQAKQSGGRMVYTGRRGKTGQEFTFMILKPAMAVLEKYDYRLPLLSNVKYNAYLKVVAQAAGVDKPVSTHWARHTGATLLLNEGVDMETVARILGHSSTRITRSTYARLLDDTVRRKMEEAERRMEGQSPAPISQKGDK